MIIELKHIKPNYMSEEELSFSDIYMQDSVVFEKGRKYLIKANSGHGKTSILNFIYGSNNSFEGNIAYNNQSLKDKFQLRKDKISYVFQDLKLFPELSIFENIQLKNRLTNYKTKKEIESLVEKVCLSNKMNSLVKNLSFGQKQRVAIVRSFCQPFDFLLLDEPFSHLDKSNIALITKVIISELENRNGSLIMTSLGESYSFDYDKILNL